MHIGALPANLRSVHTAMVISIHPSQPMHVMDVVHAQMRQDSTHARCHITVEKYVAGQKVIVHPHVTQGSLVILKTAPKIAANLGKGRATSRLELAHVKKEPRAMLVSSLTALVLTLATISVAVGGSATAMMG